MAEFQVTRNEVQTKAAELQQISKQMRTKIEELTQLEQTLSGMWEGEAHDAFHGTYGQNEQKMLMFVNALENYFLTLNEIAVKYNNAEAKNIQTAQSGHLLQVHAKYLSVS